MVEKSGIAIPFALKAGILLYLDSPEWQGRNAEGVSQLFPLVPAKAETQFFGPGCPLARA
jgi:hypothetical protein